MADAEMEALFARTLTADEDDENAWRAIHALQTRGTREVFEFAAGWCTSDEALKRKRGADVLAQMGKTEAQPVTLFREESAALLMKMLEGETDPGVQSSAIVALGHLEDAGAIPSILKFIARPASEVRFAVAFALGHFANEERAAEALLKLMRDSDDDVRDWATFHLGVIGDRDSDEIRKALLRNLADEDEDVREEAMVGLAKRKDLRALSAVRTALRETCDSPRGIDAARALLEMDGTEEPTDAAGWLAALARRFPE